jgi:hypothetical protein
MMSNLREVAYRIDPALWVHHILGVEPTKWHADCFKGTARRIHSGADRAQCSKTTTAAWAITCSFVFARFAQRGRLPCAAVRRVRKAVIKAGDKLEAGNVLWT